MKYSQSPAEFKPLIVTFESQKELDNIAKFLRDVLLTRPLLTRIFSLEAQEQTEALYKIIMSHASRGI
jgi:hypothetical protein